MSSIFKSNYFYYFILSVLLLFLFQGIFKTYAFTDGYEFIWNSAEHNSFVTFIQQGRFFSGWIITTFYPAAIDRIGDYSYLRAIDLICLFISVIIVYRILIRNHFENYSALIVVVVFIASPYSSIIVHWEATASCIWALPFALLSGEIIFTRLLKKETLNKKKFYGYLIIGVLLGVISLFTYQPGFTAAIFPAFVHFLTGQKRKYFWQFIVLYFIVFILYFVFFQIQLSVLNIPPNERAGIAVDSNKLIWFLKGAFIRSFQYSFIIGSYNIINAVRWLCLLVIVFVIFKKYKTKIIGNPLTYSLLLLFFYILAYLPSFISIDSWISYRTMSAIALLSSTLLIYSIMQLPIKKMISKSIIGIVAIACIILASFNNNAFTSIATKEYEAVKHEIEKKLNTGYPDTIKVIMVEENFLVSQKIIKNVVTDEIGKLSNSVDWAAKTMPLQLIYEITGDKEKVKKITINCFNRSNQPFDLSENNCRWILDIEKIYLSSKQN